MFQKRFSKILIFSLVIFLTAQPLFALADGFVLRPLPGAFDFVDEDSQQAFINHQDRVEKLIIAVDVNKESSSAVWLVPIPAKPEQVKVDIVSSLPRFFGEDVIKKAKKAQLSIIPEFILTNQTLFIGGLLLVSFPGATSGGAKREGDLVSVFQHLEKAGMVSEVITAENNQALYNYLSGKGLTLEPGAIPVLNEYIGKEYTFVASWISAEASQERSKSKDERGIFITFPSKKIYYPLMLTSVYGKRTIPITIRVVGHTKPKLYPEIEPFVETTYYTEARRYGGAIISRCISALSQMRTVLVYHYANDGVYPESVIDLEQMDDSQFLMEDIKRNCNSVAYQVSPAKTQYAMTTVLGSNKEWAINSEGFAGEREITPPVGLADFYGSSETWQGAVDYTKITIDSPAENFKKDLWITPGRPAKVWVAKAVLLLESFLEKNLLLSYLLFNAVLSFLIGGLLGLAFFRKFKRYAFIGLANLATILGLALAFYIVQKRTGKGMPKRRPGTLSFIVVFSVILIVLSFLLTSGLKFLI